MLYLWYWSLFNNTAIVIFWPFDPAQNAIQGDAPEGSDTFQWQLWEEMAWAEIGWWNGTSWQLFILDDDQTCDFKDRVGVEPLYNSVEFDDPVELSSGSSWVRRPGGQWSYQ